MVKTFWVDRDHDRYDDYDRTLVAERVEQFRDQVRRRLGDELTEAPDAPPRRGAGRAAKA